MMIHFLIYFEEDLTNNNRDRVMSLKMIDFQTQKRAKETEKELKSCVVLREVKEQGLFYLKAFI